MNFNLNNLSFLESIQLFVPCITITELIYDIYLYFSKSAKLNEIKRNRIIGGIASITYLSYNIYNLCDNYSKLHVSNKYKAFNLD